MKTFTMSGANINGKKGSYLKSLGNVAMTCVNYVCNGTLVTGVQSGGLVKWNGNSAAKPIMHHSDAIWAIENINPSSFITGGNDGKVITWNAQLAPTGTFEVGTHDMLCPGIRSLDVSSQGEVLVGTRGATVFELSQDLRDV